MHSASSNANNGLSTTLESAISMRMADIALFSSRHQTHLLKEVSKIFKAVNLIFLHLTISMLCSPLDHYKVDQRSIQAKLREATGFRRRALRFWFAGTIYLLCNLISIA